jgi:uncharacterized OsmC-like protein
MYKITVEHQQDMKFKVKGKDAEFIIDANGGAIAPLETLLAALGSCVGVYTRYFSQKAKVPLEKFSITLQAELTEEPPYSFKKIEVQMDLKGVKLDQKQTESLLRTIKSCPVHQTLKSDPEIVLNLNAS